MAQSQAAKICRFLLRRFCVVLILFCRGAVRRPFLVAILFAAVVGAAFLRANSPRFVFSPEDMAGEGVLSADELKDFKTRYSDGTTSLLILSPPSGSFSFTTEQLCKIRQWYSSIAASSREVLNSGSTFNIDKLYLTERGALKLRNLLELDCHEKQAHFDASSIKHELNATPWALVRDRGSRLELIFSFTYRDAKSERFGAFNPGVLNSVRASLEKDLLPGLNGAAHYWVGPADYQWYVQKGLSYAGLINLGMLLIMIFSLRACYGTWRSGLIYSATIVVSGFLVYGMKALVHSPIDVLSSGLFIMLGLSALEDFTFISNEQMNGHSLKRSISMMIVPSFFTSLTTVIGFLSLHISDLAIIRRFGLWSAYGAIFEWLVVFIVLPVVLNFFKADKPWVRPEKA
ncbi:MAG: hypothetical protein ABL958_16640 [Bdellovibrionia bacterium]